MNVPGLRPAAGPSATLPKLGPFFRPRCGPGLPRAGLTVPLRACGLTVGLPFRACGLTLIGLTNLGAGLMWTIFGAGLKRKAAFGFEKFDLGRAKFTLGFATFTR